MRRLSAARLTGSRFYFEELSPSVRRRSKSQNDGGCLTGRDVVALEQGSVWHVEGVGQFAASGEKEEASAHNANICAGEAVENFLGGGAARQEVDRALAAWESYRLKTKKEEAHVYCCTLDTSGQRCPR